MPSTLVQQQFATTNTNTAINTAPATVTARNKTVNAAAVAAAAALTTTATVTAAMAWSNEKLRFSCIDNIGLKQLWKLIALDTTTTTTNTATANNTQTATAPTTNSLVNNKNKTNYNHNNEHNNNNNKVKIVDNLQQQQQTLQQQQQVQRPQEQIYNNNNNNNEKMDLANYGNIADYLTNRDIQTPNGMSLLTFLAINALELSAPAAPVLLQHNQANQHLNATHKPQGWMQLSGHPESIVPTHSGIVRKRVASFSDSEVQAYRQVSQETQTAKIVPHFYGTHQLPESNEHFIELQDLLAGFKDPCVMDIKMGCRTFLEAEVSNETLRADLYKKMIAVDAQAPSVQEHEAQAITKLRYMLFREAMSSSQSKGFRIEALRLRGRAPVKDLKTVRTDEQISQTIQQFLNGKKAISKELIKRLKHMRAIMEKSQFFQRHEIVGSSIFIVYDDDKVGAWLIDFAKSRALPVDLKVTHRSDWTPGNREEGLLKGMDELINAFEHVHARYGKRKCLDI